MTDYNDKEILKLFKTKGREEQAFLLLVEKYQERLYWHVRKIVIVHENTDDVIQNAFIKIWKNLENVKKFNILYNHFPGFTDPFSKCIFSKYPMPEQQP